MYPLQSMNKQQTVSLVKYTDIRHLLEFGARSYDHDSNNCIGKETGWMQCFKICYNNLLSISIIISI